VLTDMWTSLAIMVGVLVVWMTGLVWLDPLIAIAAALNITWTGFGLIRSSFQGLMERSDPGDTQRLITELASAQRDGTIAGFHQVRHRRVDDTRWIEYHLLFPNELALTSAHARSHDVEERIKSLFVGDEIVITAHLEPLAHEDAHPAGHTEPTDPFQSNTP
jgi:cation diffusion facilitator family transporter